MRAFIAAAIMADAGLVLWGPVIALVTGIAVALIGGKVQLRAVEQTTEVNESSVLLTGYNQLVASLQRQVADVQSDYNDLRERATKAESAAEEAVRALEAAKLDYNRQITELRNTHERDLALLHAEIANLRVLNNERNR